MDYDPTRQNNLYRFSSKQVFQLSYIIKLYKSSRLAKLKQKHNLGHCLQLTYLTLESEQPIFIRQCLVTK